MGGLVGGDGLQVGVEWVGETGSDEFWLSVVGKTLTVEGGLEMLKSQSVVENVNLRRVSPAVSAEATKEINLPSVIAARLTTGLAETKDAAARAAMESENFMVVDWIGSDRIELNGIQKSDGNERGEVYERQSK